MAGADAQVEAMRTCHWSQYREQIRRELDQSRPRPLDLEVTEGREVALEFARGRLDGALIHPGGCPRTSREPPPCISPQAMNDVGEEVATEVDPKEPPILDVRGKEE